MATAPRKRYAHTVTSTLWCWLLLLHWGDNINNNGRCSSLSSTRSAGLVLCSFVESFSPPPSHKSVSSLGWRRRLRQMRLLVTESNSDNNQNEITTTMSLTTPVTTSTGSTTPTSPPSSSSSKLQQDVTRLKKVLEREYISFFDPMKTEYYDENVTFDDPLTSLVGIQSYKNNVDMLGGRTLLGKVLFNDASINLHSVTGGEIKNNEISDITTRWTLKFEFQAIPWKPTARFTGISVYKVKALPSNPATGVQIVSQQDYWDSINIAPDTYGDYATVDKAVALTDFLNQLKPSGFTASSAAPELPYELLRRGNGYEVRRYPPYASIRIPYLRRDEGFGTLGSFTRGMNPMSPAIMEVKSDDTVNKYMKWPVAFALPGESSIPIPSDAKEKAGKGQFRTINIDKRNTTVVAVADLPDASMEPVVRFADRKLRRELERDGLKPLEGTGDGVVFAQYDAIFSMGKRRGEVWIELQDHPWLL